MRPPEAPARVGLAPAERLTVLREATTECMAPSTLPALIQILGKMRELALRVNVNAPLFDECVDAIVRAQQRVGKLLLAGAESDLSTTLVNRCTRFARMTDSDFLRQREIERDSARERRRRGGAVPIQVAITHLTPWVRTGDGCMTRWLYGLTPGEDPRPTARLLVRGGMTGVDREPGAPPPGARRRGRKCASS